LADAVSRLAAWSIPHFGCTDCDCPSHLFGFSENPIHSRTFMAMVEAFRINRLDGFIR
jgi:sugar fermentation stimulation protein A